MSNTKAHFLKIEGQMYVAVTGVANVLTYFAEGEDSRGHEERAAALREFRDNMDSAAVTAEREIDAREITPKRRWWDA